MQMGCRKTLLLEDAEIIVQQLEVVRVALGLPPLGSRYKGKRLTALPDCTWNLVIYTNKSAELCRMNIALEAKFAFRS